MSVNTFCGLPHAVIPHPRLIFVCIPQSIVIMSIFLWDPQQSMQVLKQRPSVECLLVNIAWPSST